MKWKLLVFVVSIFATAGYFTFQAFAQQAAPPVFGCLGLGGQQCSFIQVAPPNVNLSVNGKPLKNSKRVLHYGDTITGSVSYKNTGSLPITISKMGVAAKKGSYEVFFTPAKEKTVLTPGQTISIPVTSHKFNYPDPPGDWSVAGRVSNSDGQSVDGNKPDLFTLVAECRPLHASDPTADADKLNQYCEGKTNDALCQEFCEVKPDLAKNCTGQEPGQGNPDGQPDPNASDPGQLDPQQPDQGQPDQQNPGGQNPNTDQPEQDQPNQDQPDQGQPDQPDAPDKDEEQNPQPDAQEENNDNDNQNVIEQVQQQFQEFWDEIRKLLGITN